MSLEFFNQLSLRLLVNLSDPARPASDRLLNLVAAPAATIASITIDAGVADGAELRSLTDEERDRIVFRDKNIRLCGLGKPVTHHARSPVGFRVCDLIEAIAETERTTRHESDWMGGIDVHHVYFEGLELAPDGSWNINWGS